MKPQKAKKKERILLPEDIMMVAVKHEVSERYVKMIRYNERRFADEKAAAIAADLETLAIENQLHQFFKEAIIEAA